MTSEEEKDSAFFGVSISLTKAHIDMLHAIREHLMNERVEPVSLSSAVRECILVFYANMMKEGK